MSLERLEDGDVVESRIHHDSNADASCMSQQAWTWPGVVFPERFPPDPWGLGAGAPKKTHVDEENYDKHVRRGRIEKKYKAASYESGG